MNELRLNIVTREWVVIAADRLKRPHEFKRRDDRRHHPAFLATCPFCPGNESKTPKELYRIDGDGGDGKWKVRVVPNKYPALSSTGERTRNTDRLKRAVSGVGLHEIIVDSPSHSAGLAQLDQAAVEALMRVYRQRFIEAHADPRVEHVTIFKNSGEAAGTTLDHPNTQLIALPVAPHHFRDRIEAALRYFDDTGECMYCDIIKMETAESIRVVIDTPHFLTFIPYAALSPFHTWIFPKRHTASFADTTDEELKDLAHHMRTTVVKLNNGLDNPDYNYIIRSSRPQDCGNPYTHWYITLVPRLTTMAGFELGSGMYLNPGLPEEVAAYMRSIHV